MNEPHDMVNDLLEVMNKNSTSEKAYLQGEHARHTWGLKIPHLAPQWCFGGSDVIPGQRYLGISGERKAFKSTMGVEIGNWFIAQGGIAVVLDTENKTSPTMYDAMTWWNGIHERNRRLFKVCRSVGEWQSQIQAIVTYNRESGNLPKGSRRPVFICIDSLTGRATEDADANLRREGEAAQRAYPVVAMQTTNFFEALNLLGTTTNVAWIQHMKASLEQQSYGKTYKEKGASAAGFHASTQLRISKGSGVNLAKHDSAPFPEYPVQGWELWMKNEFGCLGPSDGRTVMVNLLWQYVPQEDGSMRQAMWFDWDGALGQLLVNMKYSDKFKPKLFTQDKERLEQAIQFVEGRGSTVKCKELGLESASLTEFGRAIKNNLDVYDRVRRFLGITEYPDVQDADIDFGAGDLVSKGKKSKLVSEQ